MAIPRVAIGMIHHPLGRSDAGLGAVCAWPVETGIIDCVRAKALGFRIKLMMCLLGGWITSSQSH
jgi:hypothetical protein